MGPLLYQKLSPHPNIRGKDPKEGEISTLGALTQYNKDLEELLENLGDQRPESFLLENTFQKKFKEPLREEVIVLYPISLKKCSMNLWNKMDNTLPVVQMTNSSPNTRKGKSSSPPLLHQMNIILNLIIWNIRRDNNSIFS